MSLDLLVQAVMIISAPARAAHLAMIPAPQQATRMGLLSAWVFCRRSMISLRVNRFTIKNLLFSRQSIIRAENFIQIFPVQRHGIHFGCLDDVFPPSGFILQAYIRDPVFVSAGRFNFPGLLALRISEIFRNLSHGYPEVVGIGIPNAPIAGGIGVDFYIDDPGIP